MHEKEYPFLDFDAPSMFDDLLKLDIITLLEMKRPDETKKTNDPN